MAEVSTLYNTLPTLGEAEDELAKQQFDNVALAYLLAKFHHEFGLYLVHAHCKLKQGEIMLAKGDVSQPTYVSDVDCYSAENWLPTGEAFEFREGETKSPPSELLNELNRLTNDTGILGLYYVGKDIPQKKLEYSDGRKNILKPLEEGQEKDTIETGWVASKDAPGIITCTINCDTRVTRSSSVHKGI